MSSIASGTTTTTALVYTADTTGNLVLQTNGTTTAVTIGTNQVATFASGIALNGATAAGGGSSITLPSGYAYSWAGGNDYLTVNTSSHLMSFVTNGTTQLNLDTSGNLGLGTIPSAWSQGKAFEVGNYGNSLWGNSAGDFRMMQNIYYNGGYKYGNAGNNGSMFIQAGGAFYWNIFTGNQGAGNAPTTNNAAMTLDSSGNLTVPAIYTNTTASVTYVAVSSAGLLQRGGVSALKYKQNVRDLESIDISKFRAVRYNSKCENDDQTKDHFGFIADEVLANGLTELITYGETGEVEGFQYERMCVVLLKNAQEQQLLITNLQTQITALKDKVGA